MHKRNWWAMSAATVLLAVACSSGSATPKPASPAASAAASQAAATPAASMAPAVPATPTGYTELDKALGSDQPYKGKKVTIQVQWIGGEGDNFEKSVADFEKATGIDIVVDRVGSSHETVLRTRIEGNDKTLNLAVLAQPSAVVAYGQEGKLVDVASFVDPGKLSADHPAVDDWGLNDGGKVWGIPYKLDVKSTVWYPIKAFAAKGYQVPKTFDELVALSDKIVADGSHPWCIGMEAGTATGWQATDWLEDIMLRTAGIDAYKKWITNDLKFNSPEVTKAMEDAAKIFFTDKYVDGGGAAIIATHQTDPMDPMFNDDMANPGCWMQKQATWYGPDFFPDVKANPGTASKYKLGEDVGMFYFPAIDPAQGSPALTAGDTLLVIAPPDGSAPLDEVKAVAEFLGTPQGTQRWIEAGSAISANTATPSSWYAGNYKQKVATDILASATALGFDASDLMPAAVGSGEEWKQLSAWIQGNGQSQDIPTTLSAIDAAWPTQ